MKRKQYNGEEEVAILRKHLLGGVAISDLCDDYGLHPNVFYRWQKVFFEGGAAAFEKEASREVNRTQKCVEEPEGQLSRKNGVIAEQMEAYLWCKKNSGALLGGVG